MAAAKKEPKEKKDRKAKKGAKPGAKAINPNHPVWKLAKHAKKKTQKSLRQDFCVGNFNTAFDQALIDFPDELDKLSTAERDFCEGWLLLARLVAFDANADAKVNDAILVSLIANQMNPPWPHTGAG